MFCPNCGTPNPETAQACSKCAFRPQECRGPEVQGDDAHGKPCDWTGRAISTDPASAHAGCRSPGYPGAEPSGRAAGSSGDSQQDQGNDGRRGAAHPGWAWSAVPWRRTSSAGEPARANGDGLRRRCHASVFARSPQGSAPGRQPASLLPTGSQSRVCPLGAACPGQPARRHGRRRRRGLRGGVRVPSSRRRAGRIRSGPRAWRSPIPGRRTNDSPRWPPGWVRPAVLRCPGSAPSSSRFWNARNPSRCAGVLFLRFERGERSTPTARLRLPIRPAHTISRPLELSLPTHLAPPRRFSPAPRLRIRRVLRLPIPPLDTVNHPEPSSKARRRDCLHTRRLSPELCSLAEWPLPREDPPTAMPS